MSSKIAELFTIRTSCSDTNIWIDAIQRQSCTYLNRKCLKIRKSQPEISIGSCSINYGDEINHPIIICPHRLLERNQVFMDCLHLLTLHQPGNELHIVSEVMIPGGSVDYFLISTNDRKVMDFVGIEFQTLDTTGTIWPERQRFLKEIGISVNADETDSAKSFGMNWKMTAKTILVQLHHKIQTFEHLNKHFVLVIQDQFLDYMNRAFSFDHINTNRLGDPMQFHSYRLKETDGTLRLELSSRLSTDSNGIATCLGLQAEANVALEEVVSQLEAKISDLTLLSIFPMMTEEISDN